MTTQIDLRKSCLNFWELLALNIALISPTMTAALIIPLMYSTSGNAGWLAYAVGAVMLLFVALNLNQFAKRNAGTGSMFTYTIGALGPTAGGLAGWCLMWAYMFIGTAGVTGFTVFAQQLLAMVGVNVPPVLLFALCLGIAWYLAYKDIQLSTVLMLVLEAVSVALILVLFAIAFGVHGIAPDPAQVSLKGFTFSNLGLGVVVAIFSLVGFEAATAFGNEAKAPLVSIPRAVIGSLIFAGFFFVLAAYVETWLLANGNPTLDKLTAPLATLADSLKVGYLKAPLAAGAMISFFSLAASCMNSGARIIFRMGHKRIFPSAAAAVHATNETPHVALGVMATLEFVIPCLMLLSGLGVSDAFNDAGTFGAFGFCGAYFFISVAAPVYLKKIGQLTPGAIAISAAAVLLLMIPAVGSVYPVPSPPVDKFPYIFLAYFAVGLVWFAVVSRRVELGLTPAPIQLADEVA